MRLLALRPVDSFFFKGHMMSEMGVPSQWSGMFPPRPNTVYGALRSAYIHRHSTFEIFAQEGDSGVQRWMGSPRRMGDFRQKALLLRKGEDILLPVPMDYRIHNKGAEPLALQRNRMSLSHVKTEFTLVRMEGLKDIDHRGQYIALSQWRDAIHEQKAITHIISQTSVVDNYLKTGISINSSTSRAEDHHFFQMKMMTMSQDCSLVSLVSDKDAPNFSDITMVSLGAENRPWSLAQESSNFSIWTHEQLIEMGERLQRTRIARIILLTPLVVPENVSFFENDRASAWNDQLIDGVEVRILTWSTGRSDLYGGWDIVRNRPKTRQTMLPAGTVFYVQVRESDIPTLVKNCQGVHLFSNLEQDRSQEGFGFAVITAYNQEVPGVHH